MRNKNSAPKGKGKVKQPKKTIRQTSKIPIGKETPKTKPTLIPLEEALKVLQAHGHTITENTVNQLAEISQIRHIYTGKPSDNSVQQKRLMLQALEKTLGVVTTAARLSGVARQTHYDWMVSDEEYNDCVKSLTDVALDFSEEKLFENIRAGKEASNIFYLKTKGKKRGYIETVHNMNQNFDDNNVHFYIPDNNRDTIEDAKIVNE